MTAFSSFDLADGIDYKWRDNTTNAVAVRVDIKLSFIFINLTQLRKNINGL